MAAGKGVISIASRGGVRSTATNASPKAAISANGSDMPAYAANPDERR
jgi:hypothetical protein